MFVVHVAQYSFRFVTVHLGAAVDHPPEILDCVHQVCVTTEGSISMSEIAIDNPVSVSTS